MILNASTALAANCCFIARDTWHPQTTTTPAVIFEFHACACASARVCAHIFSPPHHVLDTPRPTCTADKKVPISVWCTKIKTSFCLDWINSLSQDEHVNFLIKLMTICFFQEIILWLVKICMQAKKCLPLILKVVIFLQIIKITLVLKILLIDAK